MIKMIKYLINHKINNYSHPILIAFVTYGYY